MPTLPELKASARDLGIKGFSKMNKADLEKAIADATALPYLPNSKRQGNYARQNGTDRLTPAQKRRIKHKALKRNDPLKVS